MNRIKQLRLNTINSLLNQTVVMISGLILPRFILLYYGSEINGLTSSINQFLSMITFLDLGVGAVIQSALYRPLAKKEREQVSLILASARKFFHKIALLLVIYIVILIFFFPGLTQSSLSYYSTGFLIFSMSISLFGQYYFGIVNQLLLNSDQKSYISLALQIVTVILNTIACILLITNGASIQIVKLSTGIIFLIRPLFLKYYVEKNYTIDYDIQVNVEPLTQKWNGVAQHIASVVLTSSDFIILTIFSTLENVSIYSLYNLVISSIKLMITSLTNGVQSLFGNLWANEEIDLLKSYFTKIEWLLHTGVVYLFGMVAVLINSFVMLYTQGINDANYYNPTFSLLLTLAQAMYCLRLPYNLMVLAAGDYKQTQNSAIIEVIINVFISVIAVNHFGLAGVAFGTLCAMLYRTIYLAWYLSQNILYRPFKYFLKYLFVDLLTLKIMTNISKYMNISPINYWEWIYTAIVIGTLFLIISLMINMLFYRCNTLYYVKKILKIS